MLELTSVSIFSPYGQGCRLHFRVQFQWKPSQTMDSMGKIPPDMVLDRFVITICTVWTSTTTTVDQVVVGSTPSLTPTIGAVQKDLDSPFRD